MKKIGFVIAIVLVIIIMVGCSATKLTVPSNVRIENDVLKWNSVDGASGYLIFADGIEIGNVSGTSFKLSEADLVEGETYEITIRAKGDGYLKQQSDLSEPISYVATKTNSDNDNNNNQISQETGKTVLETPYFSYDGEANKLEWFEVNGADGYELQLDGQSIILPRTMKCEYTPSVTENEDFTFRMRALSPEGSGKYEDSKWSREIIYRYVPTVNASTTNYTYVNKARELGIGYVRKEVGVRKGKKKKRGGEYIG